LFEFAPAVNRIFNHTNGRGRMQLFTVSNGINYKGSVQTNWKVSTDPDAPWGGWADMGGGSLTDIPPSVGYLPDGRMQLFAVGDTIYTAWKNTTDANSAWSGWSAIPTPYPPHPNSEFSQISIGYLPDQRMQLFFKTHSPMVNTLWKTNSNPNSNWSEVSSLTLPSAATPPVVGYLPDQRIQVFSFLDDGVYSCWKVATEPDSPWSASYRIVDIPNEGISGVQPIGYLPDGRMQLFINRDDNNLCSVWKNSTDPNSDWSSVATMGIQTQFTPVVGYWFDGRMQIFVQDLDYKISTAWKTTNEPNAPWSSWVSMGGPGRSPGDQFQTRQLAIGLLPDGRMQLFAPVGDASNNCHVWSIWQSNLSAGSAWSEWTDLGTINLRPVTNTVSVGYLPSEG
jgi:hypothetical protein